MTAQDKKVVCAYCTRHISGPADAPIQNVSHTICTDCTKRLYPRIARRQEIDSKIEDYDHAPAISAFNVFFFNRGQR